MKGVLLVTPSFPPVLGEWSRQIEAFCAELAKKGVAVTVATWDIAHRRADPLPGVHVVPLLQSGEVDGIPAWAMILRRLLASELFFACVLFADPRDRLLWAFNGITIPGSTKMFVHLLLDHPHSLRIFKDPVIRQRLADVVRKASALLCPARNGPDWHFAKQEGLQCIHLPPACSSPIPAAGFRAAHGIPADSFVVLLPGEVCMAKHQLGFLKALAHTLPGSTLLFASPSPPHTGEPHIEERFAAQIAQRSDCRYVPDLDHESMAAAFSASDVVAFASPWEYAPKAILAAMAMKKPWIAVDECALAHECTGGVVVPLPLFRETLAVLRDRGDIRNSLGVAGRRLWEVCYTWDAVIPAWIDLLAQGTTSRNFTLPKEMTQERDALAREVGASVENARLSFIRSFPEKPAGISYCIITDGNEPEKLRREIESIRSQGIADYEILLGGAVPPGFDDVLCVDLTDAAKNGRLGYMRNRLVERARYAVIVVADDDMLFHPGFARGILEYRDDYDVLCVRMLNTDGTRFWDWAVYGAPTGHHLIPYDVQDPFVYVTGGMCVMR